MYTQLCLHGDLEKEQEAQDPGNRAVLPRGCRVKRVPALRHLCSGSASRWQKRLGLALQGPATPGHGTGTGRAETVCATTTERHPPLTFLERPPAARWAPASEAFSVQAARGQHSSQRGPTWRGLQELMQCARPREAREKMLGGRTFGIYTIKIGLNV